jgi:hypothetical protein
VWPQLLDALVEQVGQHGVIGMSAEVDDTGFWFELLQQADFSVYNRQEIWKLQPNAGQHEHPGFQLRLGTPADRWAVQQLISNTVPPLIQQVESDEGAEAGFLWEEGGDVLAFLRVYRGQRGTWLKPFFHPRAESVARQLIQQATAMCAPQVLYCCVRRYQQWLSRPLEESGFESLGTQAVMVRNVAVRLPRPALSPAPMREKGLEVTTPIAHSRAGGAK